jgi:hypothetical protein
MTNTAFPERRWPAEIASIEKIHGISSSGAHGKTSFLDIAGFMLSWILSQSLKVAATISHAVRNTLTFRPCLRGRSAKDAYDRTQQHEVRAKSTIFSAIREHCGLWSEKFCDHASE